MCFTPIDYTAIMAQDGKLLLYKTMPHFLAFTFA